MLFALGSKLWLIVAVIAALIFLPIGQVSANGFRGDQEVFSGSAGPYDIRVLVTPKVGDLNMTIFVSPLGSDKSVSHAAVQVSGRGPQGTSLTVGPVPAHLALTAGYHASLLIEEVGEWMFTLRVESSLGQAIVDIPIEVQEPGSINWSILGAIAFFLVIAVWLALRWKRRKGKSPKLRRGDRGKR